jgi:hypothetical protein
LQRDKNQKQSGHNPCGNLVAFDPGRESDGSVHRRHDFRRACCVVEVGRAEEMDVTNVFQIPIRCKQQKKKKFRPIDPSFKTIMQRPSSVSFGQTMET